MSDIAFADIPVFSPPRLAEAQGEHAVGAMIQIVKDNPNETVIVALGPLTNIALAIQLDPDFKQLVKAIYWTGGSLQGFGTKEGLEFNAFFDPIANYICFNETGPPINVVPLDTISKCRLSNHWRQKVLGLNESPQIKYFNLIENRSMLMEEFWYTRDTKTMAIVLSPEIISEYDHYFFDPIIEGDKTKGFIVANIAKDVGKPVNAVAIQEINIIMLKDTLESYLTKEFMQK